MCVYIRCGIWRRARGSVVVILFNYFDLLHARAISVIFVDSVKRDDDDDLAEDCYTPGFTLPPSCKIVPIKRNNLIRRAYACDTVWKIVPVVPVKGGIEQVVVDKITKMTST